MTMDEMARLLVKAVERIGALEHDIEYLENELSDLHREDRFLQSQIDDCVREWEVER